MANDEEMNIKLNNIWKDFENRYIGEIFTDLRTEFLDTINRAKRIINMAEEHKS